MDYPLENLGPEKFQQLCQSLIVRKFPKVQCFPVAQPDGGRDILSSFPSPDSDGFIVFQVKYVRKPLAETDPHKWLTEIVKEEAPKVKALIPRGAKEFYLLTNIPGTAHLDAGSIDKVNNTLKQEIGLPSICWWRDDINRLLDSAWDLKWVYPELMTGPDLIRAIIESGLTEDKERRTAAIKAFIRDQFDIDQEVKFKQVELQNKLLDLFIDVPISFRNPHMSRKQRHIHSFIFRRIMMNAVGGDETEYSPYRVYFDAGVEYVSHREESLPGAATLLLHPLAQKHMARIVLEGAPGQGKSTISQYVCQVHRMRVLAKSAELSLIPEAHRTAPVRIPFKVDLRDLATWLGKKDPFSSEETDTPPAHWRKSLEAFLAAQVRHHSGGSDFTNDDLIAVAKLSSILLVFDGLDEVADIQTRQEVVDEVIRGVNRLEENAASLQVMVTSRPAAFANSPGLPEDSFPYYQLESVTRKLIDEYAEKWLRARKIHGRQSSEFKKILKDKLDQPHLRDLARNPMQLAILLSLILTRGSSLPDKRTALYDSYIELFFSREAEKSEVVREYRDLLIDIHRYLAWVLHSEAEQGHERGSISVDRLQLLLTEYLKTEGHDPNLSKTLFTGMVERVVALVSRVEGTFEFEVQPLREYFAARFLYETAPYSPPGAEQKGTKPDRFDAIARDFYWLNVTRFYAGCYSKGELPSLVDRLQELIKEEGYSLISHPRILAATLLSDWVFAQHPKSVQEVIELILDGLGLRYVLTANRQAGASSPIALPKKCGRDELADRCLEMLRDDLPRDYSLGIISLIKANTFPNEIQDKWLAELLSHTGKERTQWMEHGLHLGSLSQVPLSDIKTAMSDDPDNCYRTSLLFRARRLDYYEETEESCEKTIDCILNTTIYPQSQRRVQSVLDLFCNVYDVYRYSLAFKSRQPVPLSQLWSSSGLHFSPLRRGPETPIPKYKALENCAEIVDFAESQVERTAHEWASELTSWDALVEKSRFFWGDRWTHSILANVAAGIKSTSETCIDFPDLLDHSKSLCRRVRYARLRAGTSAWWAKQFELANSESDQMLATLVLLTWGSQGTLLSLIDQLNAVLDNMPRNCWVHTSLGVRNSVATLHESDSGRGLSFSENQLPSNLPARTAAVLGLLANKQDSGVIYKRYLQNYDGDDRVVLEFCQQEALDPLNIHDSHWRPNLGIVAKSYNAGVVTNLHFVRQFSRYSVHNNMGISLRIAEQIASEPDKYPSELVSLAEARCREVVASKIIPVGNIAKSEGWFA